MKSGVDTHAKGTLNLVPKKPPSKARIKKLLQKNKEKRHGQANHES